MASAMPELIFVVGPQAGERAVIMTNTAVFGRSPNSDVRLVEEAASREHVRFQFTREGWVMENLSANGTLINGKRYKKNKKVILDTGDVMGVGLETKILYVSPGDDPEEALQDWRQANPASQPKPSEPPARQARPRGKAPAAPAGAAAAATAEENPARKADKQPVEGAEEEGIGGPPEKASKTLKVILLSIVLVGIVGFGLALIMRSDPTDVPGANGGGIPRLTPEQITKALEAPLNRPPSPTQAAAALKSAVSSYSTKALWEKGDLYRCVKQFKLYRAYSQSPGFPRIQYERMADAAARQLDVLIRERYKTAWKFEKAKNYRNAKRAFEELERLLPVGEVKRDSQVFKVIITNIRRHRTYIKSQMGKTR